MTFDLNITEVLNMYRRDSINWFRNKKEPRNYDAVVLFFDGEIEYNFENTNIIAKSGDLLILPRGIAYSGRMYSKTATYYVIDFFCEETEKDSFKFVPSVFHTKNRTHYLNDFEHALKLWQQQTFNAKFKIKSLLFSVISDLLQNNICVCDKRTNEIITYITENIGMPNLNVNYLCNKFFISPAQLRRNIHKATGESPNEYITALRINKARQELSYTDKTISQISADCGFVSPYYFSKCFSKNIGTSPSQYRKSTYE